jgi:putative acetyltransferase
MAIVIRDERPGDLRAIQEVNRRAFEQEEEGNLVDALRFNDGVLLSLVATSGDRVVGHILYSPVVIAGVQGAALGPMAVLPDHQRQGIGSELVRAGNARMKDAGCPFILVVGHAEFYPRFGFTSARALGITCEWDVPDNVFMVAVLDDMMTSRLSGRARYRPEFSSLS